MNVLDDVRPDFTRMVKTLLRDFAKANKGQIAAFMVLLFGGTAVSVIGITRLTAGLYKSISASDKSTSIKLLIGVVVASASLTAINFGIDKIENSLNPRFRRFVRLRLLHRILQRNADEFLDGVTPIRYRAFLSSTTQSVNSLFSAVMRTYIPNSVVLTIMTGFLFFLNWKYGLTFVAGVLVCVALMVKQTPGLVEINHKAERQSRYVDGEVFDVVSAMQSVIGRGQVQSEECTIARLTREAESLKIRANQTTDRLNYSVSASVLVVIIVVMSLAVSRIGKPNTNAVSILSALALMGTLRAKLTGLSSVNTGMVNEWTRALSNQIPQITQQDNVGIAATITTNTSSNTERNAISDDDDDVGIRFDDVTFTYQNADKACLSNFSWTLQPNRISALRAQSGSGKSTLAKLLLRLYKPDSGRMILGGKDIQEWDADELRRTVLFINQDMPFLNRTVAETIKYGNTATRDEVEAVWEDVKQFFPGTTVKSPIGRNGCNLSTGQKQMLRMCNARLSSASVLVLDEPCSGLHYELKQEMLMLILSFSQKTVFLISHDAEVCAIADTVRNM